MAISYLHVVAVGVIALASVMAVILTAPTLREASRRLRAILKATCLAIVFSGFGMGAILLAWGLYTRDEELMYVSLVPLIVAILTSNFMTRSGIR